METFGVLRPKGLEPLPHLEAREGGLRLPVASAGLVEGTAALFDVVAHRLDDLVPGRLLLRRDLEFGLEIGDAAGEVAAGLERPVVVRMSGLRLGRRRRRGGRGGLRPRVMLYQRDRAAAPEGSDQGHGGKR